MSLNVYKQKKLLHLTHASVLIAVSADFLFRLIFTRKFYQFQLPHKFADEEIRTRDSAKSFRLANLITRWKMKREEE
jgi:hypothetical protein